jgi:uncharacterized membrane protein YhaH (DUF805 family)
MNFIDAVKKCLSNYVNFNGRARRSEYWWFFLFSFLIRIGAMILDGSFSNDSIETAKAGTGILSLIVGLALLLPTIAVGVRRMHDVGKSGWFLLIPIYNLVLACTDGEKNANEYGEDPKGGIDQNEIDEIGNNQQ